MGKVVSLAEMGSLRATWRAEGRRVVFTNGCFDLLHLGHVRYLEQARTLGDLLVLGLNSDASVRLIKGEKRPILPQGERAELLAALTVVDYVVVFGEATAEKVVEAIRPDVYVKGGDYPEDPDGQEIALPEARVVRQYGGRVAILPFVEGRSTSDIIRAIVDRYGPQADRPAAR